METVQELLKKTGLMQALTTNYQTFSKMKVKLCSSLKGYHFFICYSLWCIPLSSTSLKG